VEAISPFEYDLSIRSDSNNDRYRVWFYFSISNVAQGQRVILNITNFSKTRSLYREGMSPIVKSTSRPKWERIPSKYVYYYRSPRHRKNYILSFLFEFDRESDTYFFAYSFPYTYTDLQRYLHFLDQQDFAFYKRELFCRSVQNRRVDKLTITSPEPQATKLKRKKTIFISCRVHPGESPAQYVAHGMIEFLVSDDPAAQIIRDNFIFHIVPMLNPDGVFLGNYRCSYLGFDLNRQWSHTSHWAHTPIYYTKREIIRLRRDPSVELDFYIDTHAHSTMMNGFMYGNTHDDSAFHEKELLYPKLLDMNAKDFSFSATQLNRDPNKAGTSRRTLGEQLKGAVHCYTLEVSFFCSTVAGSKLKAEPYTQESYMELGRNVILTFLDFYRLPNPHRKSAINFNNL